MAKQPKKTTGKQKASAVLSGTLPKGEASLIARAFNNRLINSGATNLPIFPEAVCFKISDLRAYLDSAERTVNPDPTNPVPPDQIGVAIMPAFRKGKVTFALVATRFTEDKLTQKVLSINNVVTGIHPPEVVTTLKKSKKSAMLRGDGGDPEEPPVGDDSFDTGSMYP